MEAFARRLSHATLCLACRQGRGAETAGSSLEAGEYQPFLPGLAGSGEGTVAQGYREPQPQAPSQALNRADSQYKPPDSSLPAG